VFYLARLLDAGDLFSPCRRLLVIANEDVGLAYSQAAVITKACVDSAFQLGLPEAAIPLAHAAVMLATAPKSNSAYMALANARSAIAQGKGRDFPRCLQNQHTDGVGGAKGQFYKYPHDYENSYVAQQYLPDELKDARFYEYGKNKNEQGAKAYWDTVKKDKK
jgi:putative ATPase